MMLSRYVFFGIELSQTKGPLLQQKCRPLGCGHVQLRTSFQRSRRNVRPLVPDPLVNQCYGSGFSQSRSLIKPLLFAVGVSAASLAGCAIWEYEKVRNHAHVFMRRSGTWLSATQKKLSHYKSDSYSIGSWWSSLRETEKVFYPILAINVLVFGAWRIKSLQSCMLKYFCSNPSGSAVCLPMVLSTFSHYSPFHLAANMYVLYSFMPAALASLGKEQFVAMYMSAGVISSFASFLYKVTSSQPGLSLGASGAIMAVLSYVCIQFPDTKLSIIFLPMYTFAASSAIKVIMGIDFAGVVLGWKFFDHAAHLGGALFGITWCYWGSSQIWGNRDKFLQYYHSIRKRD